MILEHPWKAYAVVISLCSTLYYGLVIWKFYLAEIKRWLNERRKLPGDARGRPGIQTNAAPPLNDQNIDDPSGAGQINPGEPPAWQTEAMFEKAHNLLMHLTSEIQQAHLSGLSKKDLIQMLQITLKEYSALDGSPHQIALAGRLEAECAKYGSIHLSKDEIIQVWKKVV